MVRLPFVVQNRGRPIHRLYALLFPLSISSRDSAINNNVVIVCPPIMRRQQTTGLSIPRTQRHEPNPTDRLGGKW